MQYKLYSYEISDSNGRLVGPDRHYDLFDSAKGRDDSGQLSRYRGKRDAVLMAVRRFGSDFSGLIGRHATQREVTQYIEKEDEARQTIEIDDDYPHTAFICFPRLKSIACVEGSIKADSALSRLHAILGHRQRIFFTYEPIREPIDLRKAVRNFRVTEVSFEILPVNPHTGALGEALDTSRALDHIRKIRGKAEATKANPIGLNGGLASAVQELQQSGHAKVGFRGYTDRNIEVVVPKPKDTKELSDDISESVYGEDVDIKINLPDARLRYPFDQGHVTEIRTILRQLKNSSPEDGID